MVLPIPRNQHTSRSRAALIEHRPDRKRWADYTAGLSRRSDSGSVVCRSHLPAGYLVDMKQEQYSAAKTGTHYYAPGKRNFDRIVMIK